MAFMAQNLNNILFFIKFKPAKILKLIMEIIDEVYKKNYKKVEASLKESFSQIH